MIPTQKPKFMKIKIPFVLALLFAGVLARAAEPMPLSVAVYDFKGYDEAESSGSKVTTLVTADLTTETNMVLVERAELKQALNEQAFGASGMVSSDAAAKIGQITGAKILVTGEVMNISGNHLVIVANIIGTETGRLYADKVDGSPDKLVDLTSDLSRKIAQTINDQATNLIMVAQESSAERLERIIKSVNGTNRPTVLINIHAPPGNSPPSATPTGEFGNILLKAGFNVVERNSDRKPDVVITGVVDPSEGPRHGDLFSFQAVIELKVQERRTGNIICFDRQESTATDVTRVGADRLAEVNAVDALAERILPQLAK
jgi:TolB-like protein